MNSPKKSCLALVMVVLLILAFSLPVMADIGAGTNDSVAGESQVAGNTPSENNSGEGDVTQENTVDTENPASETPADVPGGQPAPNSGSGAPAPVEVPSGLVHTSLQIRSGNISVGQDIVIDVTSELADGLASVTVSRMVIELTKFSGSISPDEVMVYAGSEQIGLTDQGGIAKGYWTPSEPITLDSSNPSAVCTFILKFRLGGEYNLNIFADSVHYQAAEQLITPPVNPPVPVPEVIEEPGDQEPGGTADQEGTEQSDNSAITEENGSEADGQDNDNGIVEDEGSGIIEENEPAAGDNDVVGEESDGGTISGENSDQGTTPGDAGFTDTDDTDGGVDAGSGEGTGEEI